MMRSIRTSVAPIVIASVLLISQSALPVQSPGCPADFDCSGEVNVFDLIELINAWGPCSDPASCPADLTGSGEVNVFDLIELINAWGPCLFEYQTPPGNTEAWQISLEMLGESGPLLPPDEILQRVERDLDLIRKAVPELVGVTHVPAWVPNQIIASYPSDGRNQNVDCLLTYYQGEVVNILFGHMHVIQFAGQSNMAAMSALFAALPETAWAEPDGLIGGDNFWIPTDLGDGVWHWWIDDGWHDCFDGCDCHIFYDIETDADGNVKVINITQWGMPWCQWPS